MRLRDTRSRHRLGPPGLSERRHPCPRCGAYDGFNVPEDYNAALDLCDSDPPPLPTIELSKIMVSSGDSLHSPTIRRGSRQQVLLDQDQRMQLYRQADRILVEEAPFLLTEGRLQREGNVVSVLVQRAAALRQLRYLITRSR